MEEARFIIESASPAVCTSSTRSFIALSWHQERPGFLSSFNSSCTSRLSEVFSTDMKLIVGIADSEVYRKMFHKRGGCLAEPPLELIHSGRTDEYGSEYFRRGEALGFVPGCLFVCEETSR